MSASNLSRIVVVMLLLVGILGYFWRGQARKKHARAIADSQWQVTYDVQFLAGQAPTPDPSRTEPEDIPDEYVLRMALPQDSSRARVVGEELILSGLPHKPRPYSGWLSGTRLLKLTTPHSRRYRVGAQFEIETTPTRTVPLVRRPTPLAERARSEYLRGTDAFPVNDPAVQRLLLEAPKEVSDLELLQWIFDFTLRLAEATKEGTGNDVKTIVSFKDATPLGRVRTFVTLCRGVRRAGGRGTSGFPARLVTGFELRQSQDAQPHVWAEVYHQSRWIPFDPVNGYSRQLPDHYLPIRYDGDQLVWVPRNSQSQLETNFSITRLQPSTDLLRSDARHPAEILDLTRFPSEMHKVLSLLLLLPLGALITSLFRNVVGIHTFGTFAPALLALSFIYADWGSGLVILGVVLFVGIVGRTLMERLHLLMIPRLSIILTLIILCVIILVSVLEYVELTPSAQAVLLPLVILTILIERLYVVIEEDGVAYALQLAIGTLVVAAFCFMLLRWEDVGRFILIYPELHCLTLAAFVAIGRYTGYRLTELWRFRDMLQTEENK